MKNLINLLSEELQNQLDDFLVSVIYVDEDYNELSVISQYDIDYSYIEAIKNELILKGFKVN